MPKYVEETYLLSDGDSAVTEADGVAAVWSDLWDYQVPVGIMHVLRPDHFFAVYLEDSQATPVEAANTTQVKIEIRDNAGSSKETIYGPTQYLISKSFTDEDQKARLDIAESIKIHEGDHIVIMHNDPAQTIDSSDSYFALETQRIRAAISTGR